MTELAHVMFMEVVSNARMILLANGAVQLLFASQLLTQLAMVLNHLSTTLPSALVLEIEIVLTAEPLEVAHGVQVENALQTVLDLFPCLALFTVLMQEMDHVTLAPNLKDVLGVLHQSNVLMRPQILVITHTLVLLVQLPLIVTLANLSMVVSGAKI